MVKQLNKIVLMCFLFLVSCKNDAQENKISQQRTETLDLQKINFFDKKYSTNYSMIVDESTPADHPIQTFLNCEDSYFTIHYVPKKQELKDFWSIKYFENLNIDNIDFQTESKEIENEIKNNFNDYAIFCYYIPSKYIDSSNGCTEESAFLAKNTIAEIYYYNNKEKNWQLIKKEKSQSLPKIHEIRYFTNNLPANFASGQKKINNNNVDWTSVAGNWKIDCEKGIGNLYINNKEASLTVMPNQIYIELTELKKYNFEKGIAYKLKEIPEDIGTFGIKLNWNQYVNNAPIAYIKMINDKTMHFYWYGFYNSKTKKRESKEINFNQETANKEIILKKCTD